jgi:P-type E1-E2 ATPase
MKSRILALGDGQNDTPMIQTADIGVRIVSKDKRGHMDTSLEKQADFVISKFDDLVTLMYHHGYNCYT